VEASTTDSFSVLPLPQHSRFTYRLSRSLTPGPPPLASMNSTPASSSARRSERSFAAVSEVVPSANSARLMVVSPTEDDRASSSALRCSNARAARLTSEALRGSRRATLRNRDSRQLDPFADDARALASRPRPEQPKSTEADLQAKLDAARAAARARRLRHEVVVAGDDASQTAGCRAVGAPGGPDALPDAGAPSRGAARRQPGRAQI
jgi:hypothetical protein